MDVLDWNQLLPVRLYREFYSPEAGTVDIELYDRSYGFGNHVGYFIDSVEVQRVCIARDTLIVTAACTTYYDTTVVYLCYDSTYVFNEATVISEPGEYDYTLTTPYGCDSNVHVNVLFEPCCVELIQCPNVVTPNGDGSNDKFVITTCWSRCAIPTTSCMCTTVTAIWCIRGTIYRARATGGIRRTCPTVPISITSRRATVTGAAEWSAKARWR